MLPSQYGPSAHGHSVAGRVVELDSLRGIAAATVVIHHLWAISHFHEAPWYLTPLTAGHEAVILFFVLSGYVLSLPFWAGKQTKYSIYFVRRVFRIYVPFVMALILSAIGCSLFYRIHLPLTGFYLKTWQEPVSVTLFLEQLLMPDDPILNGAIWTLRYEMELSLLFPFVCLFLSRRRYLPLFLLIAMRVSQSWLSHTHFFSASSATVSTLLSFIYYAPFFVVGAILAREREVLLRLVFLLNKYILYALVLAALLLYYHRPLFHLTTPKSELLTLLGASMLIIFVQDPRAGLGLTNPVCQYLGRISYSMYLVHYIVLFALFDLAYTHVSLPLLSCLCLAGTVVASHFFCIGVEEPALRIGKFLSKRLPDTRHQSISIA